MRYKRNFALKQILSVIAMLIVVPVLAFGQTNRAVKYQKNGDVQSVRMPPKVNPKDLVRLDGRCLGNAGQTGCYPIAGLT